MEQKSQTGRRNLFLPRSKQATHGVQSNRAQVLSKKTLATQHCPRKDPATLTEAVARRSEPGRVTRNRGKLHFDGCQTAHASARAYCIGLDGLLTEKTVEVCTLGSMYPCSILFSAHLPRPAPLRLLQSPRCRYTRPPRPRLPRPRSRPRRSRSRPPRPRFLPPSPSTRPPLHNRNLRRPPPISFTAIGQTAATTITTPRPQVNLVEVYLVNNVLILCVPGHKMLA